MIVKRAQSAVARVADKAASGLSKLSRLSSADIYEIEAARDYYLTDMPDNSSEAAQIVTERLLSACGTEIFGSYLPVIDKLYLPIEKPAFRTENNIRYFNITKWVSDKNENDLEKLVNVYAVLADEPCSIALIFNRTRAGVNVYLAVADLKNHDNNTNVNSYMDRLYAAVTGNFPGAEKSEIGIGVVPCLKNNKQVSVAAATNVPTEKSERFVSQTIEKLLDGIVPPTNKPSQEYTIVLLAASKKNVEEEKMHLGELYSVLSPYAQWQTDYHFTETKSVGASVTMGVNVGASIGRQVGTNQSLTTSRSDTDSSSQTNTDSTSNTVTDSTSRGETDTTTHTDGTSETDTTSHGTSETITDSTTDTYGETLTDSTSTQISEGSSSAHGSTEGTNITGTVGASARVTTGANVGVAIPGAYAGTNISGTVGVDASVSTGKSSSVTNTITNTLNKAITTATSKAVNTAKSIATSTAKGTVDTVAKSIGKNVSDSISKGVTNTVSSSVGKTVGHSVANTLGKAVTKGVAGTVGAMQSTSLGANVGANFARTSTVTAVLGKNEGITQSFTNYNIKHALELLEKQMQRLETSTALGMWNFCAYVLSEDQNVANNVAHSYLALTLGEESYMSRSAVNLWRGKASGEDGDTTEKDTTAVIASYIRELHHPFFALSPPIIVENIDFIAYPTMVNPATWLSGKELAYSLNFPKKSVTGLPVIETAQFGRNVTIYDGTEKSESIGLGKVFHMGRSENTEIELSLDSLRSHTFITGSTGSGKSNTVFSILDKAHQEDIKFLVIEPAKGEYKNVFGSDDDVSVYGTNPIKTPLLKIDPFSFPEDIHVLEHIDRLVEIFNVCWPMYAAMPAVLKSAVEKSYKDCGWDMINSVNRHDVRLFPDFAMVADNVRTIIDTSEYDAENKGAYKGSLLTRLNSLTTGLNGLMFAADEIPDEKLFEENVIIDLSRVGSSETKSLIMGMLILKLREFRMTQEMPMNSPLKHLTVLEEAHNLLKRTSGSNSSEGADIAGKSVEMLSNAIAEMRTYGEGFIIADQAPGLLDMSVIRNTNTKIIMRLPDQTDRELVGKSANLNDDQITELAKLPCGVGAVYQNEWVQPVLCKVDRADHTDGIYHYNRIISADNNEELKTTLAKTICTKLPHISERNDLKDLRNKILQSSLGTKLKCEFMDFLECEPEECSTTFGKLIYDLIDADTFITDIRANDDAGEVRTYITRNIEKNCGRLTNEQNDLLTALLLNEQAFRDHAYEGIFLRYMDIFKNGGLK